MGLIMLFFFFFLACRCCAVEILYCTHVVFGGDSYNCCSYRVMAITVALLL